MSAVTVATTTTAYKTPTRATSSKPLVAPSMMTTTSSSSTISSLSYASTVNGLAKERHVVESSITFAMLKELKTVTVENPLFTSSIPVKVKEQHEDSILFVPADTTTKEGNKFWMRAKNQNSKHATLKLLNTRGDPFDFQPVIRVLTKKPLKEHIFHLTHVDIIICMETSNTFEDKSAYVLEIRLVKIPDKPVVIAEAITEISSDDEDDNDDTESLVYSNPTPLIRSKAMAAATTNAAADHLQTLSTAASTAPTVIMAGPTASAIPLHNTNGVVQTDSNATVISNHSTMTTVTNRANTAIAPATTNKPKPMIAASSSSASSSAPPPLVSSNNNKNTTTSSSSDMMMVIDHTPSFSSYYHQPLQAKRKADISPDIRLQPARSEFEQKELITNAENTANLIMDLCPPILYNKEFKEAVTQYVYYSNVLATHKVQKIV